MVATLNSDNKKGFFQGPTLKVKFTTSETRGISDTTVKYNMEKSGNQCCYSLSNRVTASVSYGRQSVHL